MLVLSRRCKERVVITSKTTGERIVVSIDEIRTNTARARVRLSFDAPAEFEINREEVQRSIDASKVENRAIPEHLEPDFDPYAGSICAIDCSD